MTNIKRESICRHIKQIIVMLLLLSLVTTVFPFSVFAEERKANKVVRVGWHEQPYFITDENGRYSGYTYDYQQKISAYTGWIYEYVSGSWSELLQMLKDGEIDMLGNVSYTEERANDMLYSSLPMGTESYYLFASQKNKDIRMNDYSSLNGKKIGVAKDSIQSKMLKEWMQKYEVQAELIEMTTQEKESMQLIDSDIDAFVTMDFHVNPQKYVPVWKIGGSDYYFAVSKSSSDLLNDLNFAMGRIKNENKLFDVQLNEKYLQNTEAELYVSDREQEWLSKHKTIRVGYQNNYLAFCSKDERTGELIGALKDYLNYASTALKNVELNFETISYPTVSEAIADLKKGKIDCVFPANLTYYDSEMQGLAMSPEIMTTEMDAIVRSSDRKEFLQKKQVTVAVNEGNTNYELFLKDRFPGWNVKHYKDTSKGLEAVAKGEADCVIISNYRFNNISKQCEQLHLSAVYTGVNMEYYFALCKGNTDLYSILSRVTIAVPDEAIHTALTYYSTEDVKTGLLDYIKENWGILMTVVVVILLVIMLLLIRSIRAEKKAFNEERKVHTLNQKVYVDPLTSVRNKTGYTDYINTIQERLRSGAITGLAICMFDCDNLKYINDRFGHKMGDEYLKTASRLICGIFQHSPVFRVGGDEFISVLQNQDFENRDELIRRFEEESKLINESAQNDWECVNVSIGIAQYDEKTDKSMEDTLARADEKMYENKRRRKAHQNNTQERT